MNGVLVTPQETYFKHTATRFGTSALTPIELWTVTADIETATGNLLSFSKKIDESASLKGITIINCSSTSPSHLPARVKAGDRGSTPAFSCDNNVILGEGSWSAENAGNDNLKFIITTQTIGLSKTAVDEVRKYTLDPQGNIISFEINEMKDYAFAPL